MKAEKFKAGAVVGRRKKKKPVNKPGIKPAIENTVRFSDGFADKTNEKSAEARKAAAIGTVDPSGLLGAAVWLMLSSSAHKHLFVTDFEWLVVPPILAKQFRLFRRDNVPVGFISWALLDDEAEARIINGSVKLAPNEWNRGDRFWIIDVIAPFGGIDDMMKDLKEKVFKNNVVKYIQADEDGRRIEILK